MSKQESRIILMLALLMGFIGGNLSGHGRTNIAAVAQEPPPSTPLVKAESITLTDGEGRPRIRLQTDSAGEPQMVFLSQAGEVLTRLGTGASGLPELYLNDPQGQPRIRLSIDEANAPHLDLLGEDPVVPTASFALTGEGTPYLQMNTKEGTPRARLSVAGKGMPRLALLSDSEEQPSAVLGLTEAGVPELEFRALEGAGAASLYFVDDNPRLSLRDKEEKVNLALEARVEEPLLRMYSEEKLRASLSPDQFLLSDQDGTSRLSLRIHQGGEPSLSLKDNEGHRLVSLSIQPLPKKEEPLFALYDKQDLLRAGLSLSEEGEPNFILRDKPLLSLVDKEGKDGIYLSLEGDDRPNLYLSARQGRRSAFFGLRKKGEMAIDLMGEREFPRASLLLNSAGEPALQLLDKEEKLRWSTPPLEAIQ